jgi:hypothetical protein
MDDRGAPGRTRTCGLLVRSQSLYPAELRAHGPNIITRGDTVSGMMLRVVLAILAIFAIIFVIRLIVGTRS